MTTLTIRLLGGLLVDRDDRTVTPGAWPTQKVKTLLAILLTERDSTVPTERLVELLWPTLAPDSGENSLRVAISNLRRLLEPTLERPANSTFILTRPQAYLFQTTGDCWIDVDAFQEALARGRNAQARGRWREAVAAYHSAEELYRGDYLEDQPYADWAIAPREQLREAFLETVRRRAECQAQLGLYRQALAGCRKLLAVDHLRESVYRQMMIYHYQLGRRAQALRVFEQCRHILAQELGVDPMRETLLLHQRILQGAFPARVHHLPRRSNTMIGRDAELAAVVGYMREPACHLLTLVGPGGVGKTRLALEAVHELLSAELDFLDGVYFAPLSAVDSRDALVAAIASALGFSFHGSVEPRRQLINYLRQKELLLVLDGFEHLIGESDLLRQILQQAPAVKLLVTSRARLNLKHERLLQLEGLSLPPDGGAPVAEAESFGAVQLFLESAQRIRPDLGRSPEEMAAVIDICRLVEGMPLALELAATWVRVLSCAEIASEIERGLEILETPARDGPQRQRSLHAVFDHSWRLLKASEQERFRSLAVFRGGFQRKAAEEVADASLRQLSALIDRSLLRRTGRGRYELQELLRQYVLEKLRQAPEAHQSARDRHTLHYLSFLGRRGARLTGAQQQQTLAEIGAEIENIQAAWSWAVGRGDIKAVGDAAEAVFLFYERQARFKEGRRLFGRAVAAFEDGRPAGQSPEQQHLLARLLARQGRLQWHLDDYGAAREGLQKSLALSRGLGARPEAALALNYLGALSGSLLNFTEATHFLEESLAIYRDLGDERGIASVLYYFGVVLAEQGEFVRAKEVSAECLLLYQQLGDPWNTARATNRMGALLHAIGEYPAATSHHEQSLSICRTIGDHWGEARAQAGLGAASLMSGNRRQAKWRYQESRALARETGDRWLEAVSVNGLGAVAADAGDHQQAKGCYEKSLQIFQDIGDRWGEAWSYNLLGRVAVASGEHARARKYLSRALAAALDIQAIPRVLQALLDSARLFAREGELELAAKLTRTVHEHPAAEHTTRLQAVSLLDETKTSPGTPELANAPPGSASGELNPLAAHVLSRLR